VRVTLGQELEAIGVATGGLRMTTEPIGRLPPMHGVCDAHSVGVMGSPDAPTVHVLPGPYGGWLVRVDDESHDAAEHATVNHAERQARRCAERLGVATVLVHDRYARVHRVSGCARASRATVPTVG
jgi:hypothetical protein